MGPVTAATTAWMDQWWDDDAGLLWNPPGSFEGVVDAQSVHLVRETAWYAIGLLRRDGPGDRSRSEAALSSVVGHQYDAPGQAWHGTFTRFPEWAPPVEGATEWIDYDPNWRQFLGSALAVAVTDFGLPTALEARARDAVHLAVDAEPPDRVPPSYANIALLRAWLDAWAGRPDDGYAQAVVDTFRREGCFAEYGSPTYYGIDLLALGLWERTDAPDRLQRDGSAIEAALWGDIARWWHAGLGNLCGPYSRAYGMDLGSYVSGLSLALWCAELPAPMPSLHAQVVPHGHDVCMAPLLEHVGVRVPGPTRIAFERFQGPHAVHQVIGDEPRREATGWLEEMLMVGAESGDSGLHARDQFHPATVHWRRPDGSVGWLRIEHPAPTRATAGERTLVVDCDVHHARGAQPVRWITNTSPLEVGGDGWRLPGLRVDVTTGATLVDPEPLEYHHEGGARFELQFLPDP